MNYETWRATYQSSEQAARAAFEKMEKMAQKNTPKADLIGLITEIGIDSIRYQMLSQCMVSAKKRKEATEICFHTEEVNPINLMQDSGKVGVILWADREKFNESLSSLTNKGE